MKTKITLILLLFLYAGISAQTVFSPEAGLYTTLLNDLKNNLYTNSRVEKVTLDGKERLMFVEWVRDHIHTMKAYKYWEKDMASYIAFLWNIKPIKECISIIGNRTRIKM
ncbi:MAG: hypothetical protein HC830_00925 [Bacteroidetes bacterium]|nr:hypothetical protein [Bacteroidales bacterium]NJO68014.1 hypothetical protein [Bacteroidota bacterium]